MSSLYIEFASEEAAHDYLAEVPGMELVPGANAFEALYGDDRDDARSYPEFWGQRRVMPRLGVGGQPHPLMPPPSMPLPWPVIVGYDGMHPRDAGVAMKAESGAWVPVARFDPPLSTDEQAAADKAALDRYADRCAEHAVMGSVVATTLAGSRRRSNEAAGV